MPAIDGVNSSSNGPLPGSPSIPGDAASLIDSATDPISGTVDTRRLAATLSLSDFRAASEAYAQIEAELSQRSPFTAKHKSLALRWGTWLARLSYEEGKKVVEDSAEISRILGPSAPLKVAGIDKRIRAVFGDDDAREYTNQTIYVTDFLRGIEGAIVFDPQQNDILQPPGQKDRGSSKSRP